MIKKALVVHIILLMLALSQFAFAEEIVWETFESSRIIHNLIPYATNSFNSTVISYYDEYPEYPDDFYNLNIGLMYSHVAVSVWVATGNAGAEVQDGFAQTFVVANDGWYELEIRAHVDAGKLVAATIFGLPGSTRSNSFSLSVSGNILSGANTLASDTISLFRFDDGVWPIEDDDLFDKIIEDKIPGGNYLSYTMDDAASAKMFSRMDFVLSTTAYLEAGKTYEWSFISSSHALAGISGVYLGGNASRSQMRYEIDKVSVIYFPIIVSASAGPHGTIYPRDSEPIVLGGSKTFDTVPDIGYEVGQWLSEEDGSVLQDGGTSYTISDIQGDTTIHVTFKEKVYTDESITVTLSPWYDTDANEQYPNNVYYNSIVLHADTLGTYDTNAYIGFHLNNISRGSVVSEAVLNVWGRGSGGLYIYELTETVSGGNNDSISWDNRPNYSSVYLRFMMGQSPSDGNYYHHQENIKDYIQRQVDADDDCELVLKPISVNTYVTFASDEYSFDNSVKPKLVITYIPPPPPDLIITDLYPETSPSDNTYYVGQSIDWHVTVRNNDSGPADSSSVGYYLGTSSTDLTNRLSGDLIGVLVEGESDDVNDSYIFSESDIGLRYLICRADDTATNEESNEDNNIRVYGPFNVVERKVATPIFSPNGGEFIGQAIVSLSCSTPSATIRYTMDGTIPTASSTEFYRDMVWESSDIFTFIVTARAFKDGYTDSDIASASFTITQEEASELSVIPNSRTVSANSGTTTFTVNNIGISTMSWTASVISGGDWLSITSGLSGTNSGTISIDFSTNTSSSSRTGTVRVTAPGAIGNPKDVIIIQSSLGTTDVDNDGLPDNWENQHFGNLTTADDTTDTDGDGLIDIDEYAYKTDPNDTDTDLDGDSDGDEVLYGTDPTLITDTLDNHRPVTPVISQVLGDVPLRDQIFDVDSFDDPDQLQGDYLSASEWQISMDQNFDQNSIIIFERIIERQPNVAEDDYRQLRMPQGILSTNTNYWIRTRHRDRMGLWSSWSGVLDFTTVAVNPNDQDDNGIDDAYEVVGYVDTNDNGIDDSQENICAMYDAEDGNEIGMQASNGVLGNLSPMPTTDIPAELLPADPMPYGMFSFRITGLPVDANNPATADITIYFPDPLPSDTKWYKYDIANGTITDFTSNVIIIENRVILMLTDGGSGDADGVVNGTIVDPGGVAIPLNNVGIGGGSGSGVVGVSSDGSGGGGCFIATAAFGSFMEPSVTILRQFRDLYLLPNEVGRFFINAYYRYSPPMADFIAEYDSLRAIVRLGLAPVVGICWIILAHGPLSSLLLVFILFGSVGFILRKRKT